MKVQTEYKNKSQFPGLVGNPFDRLIHGLEKLEFIPAWFFVIILAGISITRYFNQWLYAGIFLGFLFVDWLLLFLLPYKRISFGPSKPPALLLAFLRLPFTFLPIPWSFILQALGTSLVIYGFWIEPQRITLTNQSLLLLGLVKDTKLRIIHLGDLHMERSTRREEKILSLVRELRPDMILFSGDILNLSYIKDKAAWQDARRFLSELAAPLGVFTVTGSPAVEIPEDYPELIHDLPLKWLKDEIITVSSGKNRIEIVGLTCTHQPNLDFPRLKELVSNRKRLPRILLYHTPDLAPEASALDIDLQLSGHTHGGQVRLPLFGALFTGCLLGKKFESGQYGLGEMTLYVTRGIGMEGAGAPRVRVLCPPEITLWELSGK